MTHKATVLASDNGNFTFTVHNGSGAHEGVVHKTVSGDGAEAYVLEYSVGNHVSTQDMDAAVMFEVMSHLMAGKQCV